MKDLVAYNFYNAVRDRVFRQRGITVTSDSIEKSKGSNRAILLFSLEIILYQHRKKYASKFSPLLGKNALYHKVLMKYKWSIQTIKALSLHDAILCLQEEINDVKLNDILGEYIYDIKPEDHTVSLDDIKDDEWDPLLHERYLQYSEG